MGNMLAPARNENPNWIVERVLLCVRHVCSVAMVDRQTDEIALLLMIQRTVAASPICANSRRPTRVRFVRSLNWKVQLTETNIRFSFLFSFFHSIELCFCLHLCVFPPKISRWFCCSCFFSCRVLFSMQFVSNVTRWMGARQKENISSSRETRAHNGRTRKMAKAFVEVRTEERKEIRENGSKGIKKFVFVFDFGTLLSVCRCFEMVWIRLVAQISRGICMLSFLPFSLFSPLSFCLFIDDACRISNQNQSLQQHSCQIRVSVFALNLHFDFRSAFFPFRSQFFTQLKWINANGW